MLKIVSVVQKTELCNVLMLQFTIKPLDKKKDVFKFYSSQLRVNKLVGVLLCSWKGSTVTELYESYMKYFWFVSPVFPDPAVMHR